MSSNTISSCPVCCIDNTYHDSENFICPNCAHEWPATPDQEEVETKLIHKDIYGTILNDGDSVILIKDLQVKGSSLVIKGGAKIKNI